MIQPGTTMFPNRAPEAVERRIAELNQRLIELAERVRLLEEAVAVRAEISDTSQTAPRIKRKYVRRQVV